LAWTLDARMPVMVVANAAALAAALAAGPPAAVLAEAPLPPALSSGAAALEGFEAWMPHAAACGCCGGRPPVAVALDRLFQARVRGQCAWFERVLALAETPEAFQAVAATLNEDAVTVARFRLAKSANW
jgi:hypothetical protein